MTKNDIRNLYTQKVAELLAQGYQINPETMGGSPGRDGTHRSPQRLRNPPGAHRARGSYSESYGDILTIRVGRNTDDIRRGGHTIWNDHLETLSEIKLARISENFYTTLEEGKRMAELRYSRWGKRGRNPRWEVGDAYKSVAFRWLRRQPRMKTCKLEDITRMYRRTRSDSAVCFEIEARVKTYYLHA